MFPPLLQAPTIVQSGLLTILCKSMAIIDSDTVENSIADTDTDTHALKYRR